MGTMGLALPWKARISSTPRERGTRVEPSEHFAGGPNPAAMDAVSEDAALAAGCRSGDLRAYERFYAMHGARMKNLARNVLGSPADAEDAVQETFLKVQRSIAGFRGQSSFVTWTYRILINTCHDARRSRMRRASWHVLIRIRYVQVTKLDWPRKPAMLRCTFRKVSCTASSASAGLPRTFRARFFMRAPCMA